MRCRLGVGSLLTCLGIFACNQIVGVEDVRLRGTGAKPATTDTGDADTSNPDPVTPVPDSATTDAGGGCNGEPACVRKVFLTSATFTGKLGGLAGADAICFNAAQQVPSLKGRIFRAWLSDTTKSASDPTRTTQGTREYLRTDGSIFAQSYFDMTDGTIAKPLNFDEQGNNLSGAALELGAWTGTDFDGSYNLSSCNNWTSEASTDNGSVGDSQATDSTWTAFSTATSCNARRHLYCIEF